MKRYLSSMKIKFLIIVIGSILLFTGLSTFIWSRIYNNQLTKIGVDYADEMYEIINNNIETYFKKLRLTSYVLQNNKNVTSILDKTSYTSDLEQLNDMKMMQMILKSSMTGSEHLLNINVYTEEGHIYSAGGSSNKLSDEEINTYFSQTKDYEVSYTIELAKDRYDYPKLFLFKELDIVGGSQRSYVLMTINCKGLFGDYNDATKYKSALIVWNDKKDKLIYDDNLELLYIDEVNKIQELANLKKEHDNQIFEINGVKAVTIVKESNLTGWTNSIIIPYNQIQSEYPSIFRYQMIFIGILLIVSTSFGLFAANKFLKNIEKLTKSVEAIDGDNMSLDIEINSKDEVETLYHKFEDMIGRINNQIESIKKNERDKRKLSLKVLQVQMDPHFLYNSLNTIKLIAQMQGSDNIVQVTNSLSSIMQVNMSTKSYHTFKDELDYLEEYICIKEFQSATDIKFITKVEEELKSCYILKMLIQPLIENSLKHGELVNNPNGYISLSIYSEEDIVYIDVEDNGVGLDENECKKIISSMKDSKGIGLNNVSQRINLHYGSNYGLNITGEKGIYTRVSLWIPKMFIAGEEDD